MATSEVHGRSSEVGNSGEMNEAEARALLTERFDYVDDLQAVRADDDIDEAALEAMLRADTDLTEKALSTAASWSDYDGCTRLHVAAMEQRVVEACALLALGADPRQRNAEGDTALDLAAAHGHDGIVRTILAAGYNGDGEQPGARTALHVAAEHGQEAIARLLLESGANPDALTIEGESPLMHAASGGHAAVIRTLLDAGADRGIVTLARGMTALQIAEHSSHHECAEVLREREVLR